MQGWDKYFGKVMDLEDVNKMFDAVDIDRSGYIDYSEFVIASMNEKTLLTNEKLQAAFKMFDKVRDIITLERGMMVLMIEYRMVVAQSHQRR